MKICSKCKIEKDESEFNKNGKSGLYSSCKQCVYLVKKEYWQRSEVKKRKRELARQFTPQQKKQKREIAQRSYERNKEKKKEYNHNQWKNHKEELSLAYK